MRPQVYVTRQLPQPALEIIAAACDMTIWHQDELAVPREVLLAAARNAEGLLTMLSDRVDDELLDAAPRLKVVANMAVGYDNVDLAALRRRDVVLTNTPDVLTNTTADMAWTLILAASRRLVEGHTMIQAGGWKSWSPGFMTGYDVSGATLGVVGAGRIGGAVLRRGRGFDMVLCYHNRSRAPALEQQGVQYLPLDTLLAEADVVVVTAPLTAETRGMFGAREFALMKPTSVFVNVARGPIVQEDALYDALRVGRPWAAGLDVFEREPIGADHPLLSLPNLVAAPHLGSATVATRLKMATTAAHNLVAVVTGNAPLNPV